MNARSRGEQVALVTGAAGGIGPAAVHRLLEDGDRAAAMDCCTGQHGRTGYPRAARVDLNGLVAASPPLAGYGHRVMKPSQVKSHRADDWTIEGLMSAKKAKRVSLVVPARNEAATVGGIVARIRSALMETARLVDEIIVIDSDSIDATAEVATNAGAKVFASASIRPDLGSYPGKGEAMWKSLFVATGDVIVFMDADLEEWDTHFVPGLLGPLLVHPEVDLVKGYYRRPGRHGLDGGRVTELLARPLIAMHFPQLSDLVQPLAGEWAVRRSLFESLPVPTGYAVELAALIDTARLRGVQAIAQVDLGRRSHRHQELLDLGVMSTQILAAAARRIGSDAPGGRGHAVDLQQFVPGDDAIASTTKAVLVRERPPAKEMT